MSLLRYVRAHQARARGRYVEGVDNVVEWCHFISCKVDETNRTKPSIRRQHPFATRELAEKIDATADKIDSGSLPRRSVIRRLVMFTLDMVDARVDESPTLDDAIARLRDQFEEC